ncbi:MAG TPA: class I SAM-dependent methyltransferase [Hyphomonadaceae bacterium]|nr:class I SAM-dependent methyltransferase [Hyphomonadaceae bacterium]
MSFKSAARWVLERSGLSPFYINSHLRRMIEGAEQPPAATPDGVPLPPLFLMALVSTSPDWRVFVNSGKPTADMLDRFAREGGCGFAEAKRILDFGCGAGRVIRHLPAMTGAELHGVDYNPLFVRWCAQNLKGAFIRNALQPPLRFPDGHFDVTYLLSVFTHMRRETQMRWLAELFRVTRPGGVVVTTFHDEHHASLKQLPEVKQVLLSDGLFVHHDHFEGSNHMATYQTGETARQMFSEVFEVVRIASGEDMSGQQAVAVLRRPAA